MSITAYHILHLTGLVALLGYTFFAFAAPAETRKGVLALTGIASLVMLVSGIGLLHKLGLGFPVWAIVKLFCWLGLSALSGMAYRKREKAGLFIILALSFAVVAILMVYVKPAL
jgi:uncharacterized membrane protein SirB2